MHEAKTHPSRLVAAVLDGEEVVITRGKKPVVKLVPAVAKSPGRAGALAITGKDAFDRLLIAQAQLDGLPLASNGAVFDDFGVRRFW